MTPHRLRECRQYCGFNLSEWAYALGYRHSSRDGLRTQAHDMENGSKKITTPVALLAEMYVKFGVPEENRIPKIEESIMAAIDTPTDANKKNLLTLYHLKQFGRYDAMDVMNKHQSGRTMSAGMRQDYDMAEAYAIGLLSPISTEEMFQESAAFFETEYTPSGLNRFQKILQLKRNAANAFLDSELAAANRMFGLPA